MKILYTYSKNSTPIYINGGAGTIRLLILFEDNSEQFVYYCDDYNSKSYINKIINPNSSDKFNLNNFKKIDDDSQFYTYDNMITNLYNYNGYHKEEKIDGHDLGPSSLWLPPLDK